MGMSITDTFIDPSADLSAGVLIIESLDARRPKSLRIPQDSQPESLIVVGEWHDRRTNSVNKSLYIPAVLL